MRIRIHWCVQQSILHPLLIFSRQIQHVGGSSGASLGRSGGMGEIIWTSSRTLSSEGGLTPVAIRQMQIKKLADFSFPQFFFVCCGETVSVLFCDIRSLLFPFLFLRSLSPLFFSTFFILHTWSPSL